MTGAGVPRSRSVVGYPIILAVVDVVAASVWSARFCSAAVNPPCDRQPVSAAVRRWSCWAHARSWGSMASGVSAPGTTTRDRPGACE